MATSGGGPAAIVSPTNQGTRAEALPQARLLLEAGCSTVLLYDYQGFGESQGQADVRTLLGDAMGVLDWLDSTVGLSACSGLVAFGVSLGSLVATALAAALPGRFSVLILEAVVEPFSVLRSSFGPLGAPIAEIACSQIPAELNILEQAKHIKCPVLVAHAAADRISPPDQARSIFRLFRNAVLWQAEGCGHLEITQKCYRQYLTATRTFLSGAGLL